MRSRRSPSAIWPAGRHGLDPEARAHRQPAARLRNRSDDEPCPVDRAEAEGIEGIVVGAGRKDGVAESRNRQRHPVARTAGLLQTAAPPFADAQAVQNAVGDAVPDQFDTHAGAQNDPPSTCSEPVAGVPPTNSPRLPTSVPPGQPPAPRCSGRTWSCSSSRPPSRRRYRTPPLTILNASSAVAKVIDAAMIMQSVHPAPLHGHEISPKQPAAKVHTQGRRGRRAGPQ